MKIITPYFVIEDVVDGEKILKNLEKAGRTCYKSEEKVTDSSASVFIKKIIESGHETILEHEKITVRIICDRGGDPRNSKAPHSFLFSRVYSLL